MTAVTAYRGYRDTGIPTFPAIYGNHVVVRAALHHSAGPEARTKQKACQLNASYHDHHRRLYGDGYAYHLSVDWLGRLYVGRPKDKVGCHVALNNTGTFGVMVHGTFVGSKKLNPLQKRTLKALYRGDVKGFEFLGKVPWKGHQEFPNNATECPGTIMTYLRWLRGRGR